MSLSKWKVVALVLGIAVLGITVVSPALGGPSLRKLVKKQVTKEVTKQLAKQPKGAVKPEIVRTELTVSNGSNDSDFADCPAGEVATGGGVGWDGGASGLNGDRVTESEPVIGHTLSNPPTTTGSQPTGWFGGLATTGSGKNGFVWAICAPKAG